MRKLSDVNSEKGLVPVGTVLIMATPITPHGYLKCVGAWISRSAYAKLFVAIGTFFGRGDGSSTFQIPDARGLAIRIVDDGRGLDPGRVLGSYQGDTIKMHDHLRGGSAWGHGYTDSNPKVMTHATLLKTHHYNSGRDVAIGPFGEAETRMKTIALHAYIKY